MDERTGVSTHLVHVNEEYYLSSNEVKAKD